MKANAIIAILLIVGALYYWTDGGTALGLTATSDLPDTIVPPNATFMGSPESNPFAP
jgi:hypothetical protein